MDEIHCTLIAEGERYPIRLHPYEDRAEPAPYKWSAIIERLNRADLLPMLAERDGVMIRHGGRDVDATVVGAAPDRFSAEIMGKGAPPWQIQEV